MELREKIINKEDIFKGKIIDVKMLDVELPNGKMAKREVVYHNGAVGILAFKEDKVLIVEQYRTAIDDILLEIPAGKIDGDEDPLECAHRELREETGYISENIEYIGEIVTSAGFCNEIIKLYCATDLKYVGDDRDDDEFLNVKEMPVAELRELIGEGKIIDSKTLSAICFYDNKNKAYSNK
ncbi:NUDIX hydrolase [Oceanirhabdus seepicola]|uniref:NUDIX hydrolase n=1 Tax=Oceanirhabdus seepicola TaxID=2828781 RepID=A0A9J6P851_9CLOT|nr:NUDIX hydrolase [Oceanirhabdus seepicola]MCM1992755.1 NUDIX hydrolase [Oceanirhabdus seepicola]